jgi:hypothetical protein
VGQVAGGRVRVDLAVIALGLEIGRYAEEVEIVSQEGRLVGHQVVVELDVDALGGDVAVELREEVDVVRVIQQGVMILSRLSARHLRVRRV